MGLLNANPLYSHIIHILILMLGIGFAVFLGIIGGALILNIINFIGDRIETIKFKDFSASLTQEKKYDEEHSITKLVPEKKKKKKPTLAELWPDGSRDDQKGE